MGNKSSKKIKQHEGQPSQQPTQQPTFDPSTMQPTAAPTNVSSRQPSGQPTVAPTNVPSSRPPGNPTADPSSVPSADPTTNPSHIDPSNSSIDLNVEQQEGLIHQMCNGMSRYFEVRGVEYSAFFSAFCEEDEIDDDGVADDIGEDDPTESMLVEFMGDDLDAFPFDKALPNEAAKRAEIFRLLKICFENPLAQFGNNSPNKPNNSPNKPRKVVKVGKLVSQICSGMGRYYASRGAEYDALFTNFCYDNELADDYDVMGEMEDPSDCELVRFMGDVDNFPFKEVHGSKQAKRAVIFKLIKLLLNDPGVQFIDVKDLAMIPKFTKKMFVDISDDDQQRTIDTYRTQCPACWKEDMHIDKAFIFLLAVGQKHGFEYTMHLVDAFARARIDALPKMLKINEWANPEQHKHFKRLTQISTDAPGKATSAMSSFLKRCSPEMILPYCGKLINASLEQTVTYIFSTVTFISNLVKMTDTLAAVTICPFQIDLCFAFAKCSDNSVDIEEPTVDSDSDDDEEEEKEDKFVDCVADIESKLKANNLRYVLDCDSEKHKVFRSLYIAFREKHKLKQTETKEYLHGKRFVMMVDRRQHDVNGGTKDQVWFYEPPKDCRDIPSDAVAEWYLNASRTCLLPPSDLKDYGNVKIEDKRNVTGDPEKVKAKNIGSTDSCYNTLMTLQFHVHSTDVLKCYLCFAGQIIRFMPSDIVTVLPSLFNMEFGGNRDFVKGDAIKDFVSELKKGKRFTDSRFEAFMAACPR